MDLSSAVIDLSEGFDITLHKVSSSTILSKLVVHVPESHELLLPDGLSLSDFGQMQADLVDNSIPIHNHHERTAYIVPFTQLDVFIIDLHTFRAISKVHWLRHNEISGFQVINSPRGLYTSIYEQCTLRRSGMYRPRKYGNSELNEAPFFVQRDASERSSSA